VRERVSERDNVVYWKTKRKINDDLRGCVSVVVCGRETKRKRDEEREGKSPSQSSAGR